ncbi:hypothetical protein SprV_0301010300 [Sparganum proliferum]
MTDFRPTIICHLRAVAGRKYNRGLALGSELGAVARLGRLRSRQLPAPSPTSGLLDYVLTPGPGGEKESLRETQRSELGAVARLGRLRSRQLPAPSPTSGLLDYVLTPGPGGEKESLRETQRKPKEIKLSNCNVFDGCSEQMAAVNRWIHKRDGEPVCIGLKFCQRRVLLSRFPPFCSNLEVPADRRQPSGARPSGGKTRFHCRIRPESFAGRNAVVDKVTPSKKMGECRERE